MSISAARDHLAKRTRPVFIISRTPNWLVGIKRWAPFVRIISLEDAWCDREGGHPQVFTPHIKTLH